MQIRNKVRIISLWAASLLIAGGFIYNQCQRADGYKANLARIYSGNMAQLNEAMYDVAAELDKIVYTSTPKKMGKIAVNLSKRTAIAKSALAALPTGQEQLDTVNKFLSQVGDYAAHLSGKATQGEQITNSERQNLVQLRKVAHHISEQTDFASVDFSTLESWHGDIDGDETAGALGADIAEAQNQLEDYPTLIYDGPFSDSIDQKTSKMLENEKEISKEQAQKAAAAALSVGVDKINFLSEEKGKIEAYCFGSDDRYIAVTKRGGYILYFRKSRQIENTILDGEQAVERAREYLNAYAESLGGTFVPSYYFTDEGVCTVNFAYKQGQTVCYTDLIKVGVAMDTGEIVLAEARGFLMNHYARSIVTPKYTPQQAIDSLCDTLECKRVNLALIPTDGGSQVHCYELLCDGIDSQEVLVYLNVTTLQEEQILILLKTDGGTLTK
ncbi:MAG: germination protein YpeB [Clostridia bacterium]|nr:germination protein YpeB [Clostridia bacterium]